MALDESGGTGTGFDTLYFDGDNDGDLTKQVFTMRRRNEEPKGDPSRTVRSTEITTTFGPVETIVPIGGVPTCRKFIIEATQILDGEKGSRSWAAVKTAGYYTGKLRFEDADYAVSLYDQDGNGEYNDTKRFLPDSPPEEFPVASGDLLLLERESAVGAPSPPGRVREFSPGPFLVLDGRCYDLTVAPDGSSVSLSSCKSPCGRIDSIETYSATLISGSRACTLTGPGLNCLPVGDYFALSCDITRRDDAGSEWSIPGRMELFRGDPPIRIRKNRSQSLPIGPPLTAKMRVEGPFNSDAVYRVELDITGRAGESYSWLGITKDGQWVPDPDVEIRNAKGELVERGRIEYTRHSDAIVNCFVWRCPAAGKYTLTPIVNLGPFEVTCVPIRFTAGQPQN